MQLDIYMRYSQTSKYGFLEDPMLFPLVLKWSRENFKGSFF